MRKFINICVLLSAIGIVDTIDGDFATVEVNDRGKFDYIEVKLTDIPCEVREGSELLFTENKDNQRVITCLPQE
tara:strand:- start:196 stop:417 length:222 start_codon:yes stop_codon:yes gene_type:complete